jgi:hydrogenase maturation protease
MNQQIIDKVVNAVLYEGYILYPYRPSVKNRQRWTFGGLYPEGSALVREGTEACVMQTQCIVEGTQRMILDARIRFLHLMTRTIGRLAEPVDALPSDGEPAFEAVESLRVGGKLYQSWQEASERDVRVGEVELASLLVSPRKHEFAFGSSRELEPLRTDDGKIAAVVVREQRGLVGAVELSAESVGEGLFKITVRITNRSAMDRPDAGRDEAVLWSLASTHTILTLAGGAFVSSIDPPEACRGLVSECRNIGAFPVLVGEEGERDALLSSPIILYDYPRIAPESPGNLFDSTEIDEILSLRVMTLSDEEKQAVNAGDVRARALLERTESLGAAEMASLHGAIRGLRPVSSVQSFGETSEPPPQPSPGVPGEGERGPGVSEEAEKLAAVSSLVTSYSGGGSRWGAGVDDAVSQLEPPPPQPSPGVPGEGERVLKLAVAGGAS